VTKVSLAVVLGSDVLRSGVLRSGVTWRAQ